LISPNPGGPARLQNACDLPRTVEVEIRSCRSSRLVLPGVPAKREEMFTPKEFAKLLKVSVSALAKARKRGDGPPYFKFGRSVRYFPPRKPE
jgi:hypothetical protein